MTEPSQREVREYQEDGARQIEAAFAQKEAAHVVYVLPTGAGKTDVAVRVIKSALWNGWRVCFIAHRWNLIEQAHERLVVHGIDPASLGVIMAQDERKNPDARVQVASIQTAVNRGMNDFDLIIIDEAHRSPAGSYKRVLSRYPNAHVLGLTATPYRGDGRGLGDIFETLVVGPTVKELVSLGYLSNPRTFTVPDAELPDTSGVEMTGGDFNLGDLAEVTNKRELVGSAVDHWLRLAKDRPSVAFAVSIEHARAIRQQFEDAGVVAEHIDADTLIGERNAILGRLRSGATKVVTNCEVLTEGWDFDALGCVILMRPTASEVLYRQMIGRAMRPGGERPIILDHAGNAVRFGLADMDREHSLTSKKQKTAGVKRCKTCPQCEAVLANITASCPECGHVFWTGEPPEEVGGELVEATGVGLPKCAREGCENIVKAWAMMPSRINRRGGKPLCCSNKCAKNLNVKGELPNQGELPKCAREGCDNIVKAVQMNPSQIKIRGGGPSYCSHSCRGRRKKQRSEGR